MHQKGNIIFPTPYNSVGITRDEVKQIKGSILSSKHTQKNKISKKVFF
jgi:hypothetical protein